MSFTLRASSTPTWPDCPRRGAARTFGALISEMGFELSSTVSPVGASIGTATHAAVAHCMEEKGLTGKYPNETETEQCGLEALTNEIKKGVRWDGLSPNLNTAQKQVIRQYRSYRIHLADKINPSAIERRITVTTKRGNTLTGAIDLADDGIHDLKTGIAQRVNIAQYGTYSMLRRSEGYSVEHLTEDYIRRVAIDKEQPLPVQVMYNRDYAERVAVSIIGDIEERYVRFVETQDPLTFMANPASQLCSDRYCSAFRTKWCPESFGKAATAGALDNVR